jgi:hypothetical protein
VQPDLSNKPNKERAMHKGKRLLSVLAGSMMLWGATAMSAVAAEMTFFITSAGPGNGANLGGLEGADRHCQALGAAAGAGKRTWRAYLSTQAASLADPNAVHARDRIGTGPWFNAKGVLIARNVDELHSPHSKLTKETLLDEKGQLVNGRTEKPNRHDILTGSRPDGTAFPPSPPFGDMTCGNWTKGADEGTAMTGHHDRAGPVAHAWAISWNSPQPTPGGGSQTA